MNKSLLLSVLAGLSSFKSRFFYPIVSSRFRSRIKVVKGNSNRWRYVKQNLVFCSQVCHRASKGGL